jgi:peptide/nickel transport system substrate-binding protein
MVTKDGKHLLTVWLALLVSLSVLTLACTQARPTSDAGAVGQEQAKAASDKYQELAKQCEPGKEHWADPGPPIRGGIFQTGEAPPHLDHSIASEQYKSPTGMYEWLLRQRMCYAADTVAIPALAKSWTVSPDGLTWTFKLHENVKWHNLPPVNGRAFTSADIAWTLDFMQKASPQRRFYEGVTHSEPDPYTVVLKLKDPSADFLLMLSDDSNAALAHEVQEVHGDFKQVAVGTGPFQLKDYKARQYITYARNPNYYEMGADGKPLPYIDEIRGTDLADPAASFAATMTAQLDHNRGTMTPNEAADLKRAHPKAIVDPIPALSVSAVWFNGTVAPWNDPRVRRAISFGINREEHILGAYDGGAVHSGFMPYVLGDYSWTEEKIKERFKYDPDQAKKLLTEAGFKLNEPVKFATGTGSYPKEIEVISHQLEKLGIPNEIVTGPEGMTASGPVIRSFKFDLTYGLPGACKFPDCWMRELVAPGPSNITRVIDAKLTAMAEAQAKEMDVTKRLKLIHEQMDYMYEIMPMVPLPTVVRQAWQSCRVKNMRPEHGLNAIWSVQHAWLDNRGC